MKTVLFYLSTNLIVIIQQNISLKEYNTFGLDSNAKEFVVVDSIDELEAIIQVFNLKNRKLLILGGGSNVLLANDFDGMVIKINLTGIEKINEDENHVWIKAMAGTIWHDLVLYCVENNYAGLENLSLIPGCVGAAPMQNIGAYGVEIKDTFVQLEAIEIKSAKHKLFTKSDCKFAYRESIFKNEAKGKYIITSVAFKLNKNYLVNTTYGAIKDVLTNNNIANPTIKDVSNAVIEIRSSKLPDPKILGNAGSFFKNPEINTELFLDLKEKFPDLVGYKISDTKTKVAAGWLIEQCGWKGKVVGNTGSHKQQALVLVNYGNASGNEIWNLALQIQNSVKEKFGIDIIPEVNVI